MYYDNDLMFSFFMSGKFLHIGLLYHQNILQSW